MFPFKLVAFWLLFFGFFRLWFLLWFKAEWVSGNESEAWMAMKEGLSLDISMAGYLMVLPILMWGIGLILNSKGQSIAEKAVCYLNIAFIAIMAIVFVANIFIYEEWHTILNNRAVEYLRSPMALVDSMSLKFQIASVLLLGGLLWLFYRVYQWMVGVRLFIENGRKWLGLALLPYLGLLFVMIRGGLGVMPINESAVYYSPHAFYNHAATNTAWHFVHSLVETRSAHNPYVFTESATAAEITQKLLHFNGCYLGSIPPWDTSHPKPNIVFLIMESMTAQVIEELGGEKGVCPNLSKLIADGLLFENCYGSGYRTDQGLVSILSGYPAQPDQSVVLLQDKAAKLPSIPTYLRQQGYQTAYFYGGELTFANIGVYLRNQQFEKIISENDFSAAEKKQRWGADDDVLLQRAAMEMSKLQQPFFATAMTLSLHPPYDVPFQSKWSNIKDEKAQFLHSAAFADAAIGHFFEKVKSEPWYENTLFVLVADHGASLPNKQRMDSPWSRQIPLIFYGNALGKWHRGRRINAYGNHHDIPATLLNNLGREQQKVDSIFKWSRDLMFWDAIANDYPTEHSPKERKFAYYTNENGIGWVNYQGVGFYNFESKQWQYFIGKQDSATQKEAKAYLQTLYEDFLAL